MILDARYEKVRYGGGVVDCAVLIAKGVRPDGKRMILGVSVSLSEAEVHWRTFLERLQDRGMHGIELVVSDDHKGIKAALKARLTGVPRQRCQFHLQRNAAGYVSRRDQRPTVAADIRASFNTPDRVHGDEMLRQAVAKYRKSAPRLVSALLMEIREEWETGRIYIANKDDNSA